MRHPDLEGYSICRADDCDEVMPTEVAARTAGLCSNHIGSLQARLRQIEIRNRTAKETLVVSVNRTTKRGGNRGKQSTRNDANAARNAALRRLAMLYPAVYQVLYGEERRLRGLDPFPLEGKLLPERELDLELRVMTMGTTTAYPGASGLANEVLWECSQGEASPPSTAMDGN